MKSWNEIRKAATAFSKRWKNAYDEKSQAQSFLKEFFAVFGVDAVTVATFEHRVKFSDGSQGYVDCFWQGKILVEMKSRGKDLDAAFQQAMEYVRSLATKNTKNTKDTKDTKERKPFVDSVSFVAKNDCSVLPRAIVVSDFARMRFYDLSRDCALTEFALKDLRKYATLFGYMIGDDGGGAVATQDPVNRRAAEKMARLHDAMKAVGYTGHPLEVYLVRLLFCLFAEDTGIFKPEQLSHFIKCDSSPDGHDLAEKLASLFQTLNTPPERRLSILDESLAAFPYVNGVGKTVERYADGCWNATEIRSFVYDGWNLIHEAICTVNGTTTNATEVQYFWGPDISGTLQGAGGVGGLIAVSRDGQFYFPVYDNNGNILKYSDEMGNVVAAYEYDDFGRIISQSDPLVDFFRHRFSTKYYDAETGLYYYGYRFYHPILMRWLNRDPIGEMGGCLLYGFCSNNPLISFDLLGQYELTLISDDTSNGDVLMWYLHSNAGNVIHSNIHSANQLLDVIRRENYRRGSPITVLNLSGHGLTSGSGISFEKGKGFDVGKSYKELWPYLAENAVIRIWSCNAASTWQKCNNLRNAAIELDATIYANTGEVYSGPDGNLLSRASRRVVAWITGESEGEWRVFTPLPKIHAEGFRPAPRAFRILREEVMK